MKKKGSASVAPKPSAQVLGLVDGFLARNGLRAAQKAFARDIKRLRKNAGWPAPDGAVSKIGLEAVFDAFQKNAAALTTKPVQNAESKVSSPETDSSSEDSSEDSSSDSEFESEQEAKTKEQAKVKKGKNAKRAISPSSSSSSSSSDSDADDEDEVSKPTPAKTAAAPPPTSAAKVAVERVSTKKNLKRKAESSSSESESSSESDTSEDEPPAKRTKVAENPAAFNSSSSESSSLTDSNDTSSTSSSSEGEDTRAAKPITKTTKLVAANDTPSESSGTVVGDIATGTPDLSHSEGLMHESRRGMLDNTTPASAAKKHAGAKPTPLAQLSAQATPDKYLSNAYQSYDYAEKAYRDLSVTRGKGFTKEKNKKKRGSYRGGPIDISGGKSFKFDD